MPLTLTTHFLAMRVLRLNSCVLILFSLNGVTPTSANGQDVVPEVTAIEPKTALTTPGSKVKIFGIGFSPDMLVFFGGLQAREITLLSPSVAEVVTPYLRPGPYEIQLKTNDKVIRSHLLFTSSPAPIDSEIDRAIQLGERAQTPAAVAILTNIAETNPDYQVRAFAYYERGQIYLSQGDYLRWGWTSTFLDADKSGMAIQTSWHYRLDEARRDYLLNLSTDPEYDLQAADFAVRFDVTDNPEPRFFRGLLNARYGKPDKAKTDSDFILKLEPDNPSYLALGAYVAAVSGKGKSLGLPAQDATTDARALRLLAESAYLAGDSASALQLWSQAAKLDPLAATLACWAGKKHMAHGQQRIATSLLTECMVMAPNSKDAAEARQLLAASSSPAGSATP